MRLVIFGATGPTGAELVTQALAEGHEVRVLVRDPARVKTQHDRLEVVKGDVLEEAAVASAVAGTEAVVCALGTTNQPGTRVLSDGTRNILRAMERAGVRRLVCLTSAAGAAGGASSVPGLIFRYVIKPLFLKHVYADKARQEEEIRRSELDWVIVRPPRLTEGPRTGRYRVDEARMPSGGWQISRADLASFMLQQVSDARYVRKAPFLCY